MKKKHLTLSFFDAVVSHSQTVKTAVSTLSPIIVCEFENFLRAQRQFFVLLSQLLSKIDSFVFDSAVENSLYTEAGAK